MEGKDPKTGRFLPGNAIWHRRDPARGHRPPIYSDPVELLEDCAEYFQWVIDNPLREEKVFCTKDGRIVRAEISKMRAMTLAGLYVYLGIDRATWYLWRDRDVLKDAVERVENVIWEQKFSGAAGGLLDGAIIARELGLTDKREVSGGMSITVSPEDAEL